MSLAADNSPASGPGSNRARNFAGNREQFPPFAAGSQARSA